MAGNQVLQPGQVCLDTDLKVEQFAAIVVEQEGVGLTELDTAKNDPVATLHGRVRDAGICDHHVGDWPGQVDDGRLVQAQAQPLGHGRVAGLDNLDADEVLCLGQWDTAGGERKGGPSGLKQGHVHRAQLPPVWPTWSTVRAPLR